MVKKWYKLIANVQAGKWSAEKVGEHSVYVTLDGDAANGVMPLWLSQEQFAAWFQGGEMDVEMTVEELAEERAEMQDGH